jgi:hypothetical protein
VSAVSENVQSAQYVDFWNKTLVPKFIKYKHILVDGLTHHSEAIFPSLAVKAGHRVLDIAAAALVIRRSNSRGERGPKARWLGCQSDQEQPAGSVRL